MLIKAAVELWRAVAPPVPLMSGPAAVEVYKQALRREYCRQRPACNTAEALDHMRRFWSHYEQVNRDYLPDDPTYSVVRDNLTPVAGNDYFTFITAASRQVRFLELSITSAGTASAAARAVFQRSTGGTTGGGAQTPEEFNQLGPASGAFSNVYTTWTTQPTLSGNPYLTWGWNAFGGSNGVWKAMPGEEIYQQGSSEQISFRNTAGTAVVCVYAIFEEM
jgi:hypothetical protein